MPCINLSEYWTTLAPFYAKALLKIGAAAYLREHLEKNL